MSNSIRIKELPLIQQCDFIVSVDTYDKPICAYALFRRTENGLECINVKSMNDYESFKDEVENLTKYFNATQICSLQ